MLQVQNVKALKDHYRALRSNEIFLQEILEIILAQPVNVLISGQSDISENIVDENWFLLRSDAGFEIALDLRNLFGIKQRIEYLNHTVLLAYQLQKNYYQNSLQSKFNVVDPLSHATKFQLYEIKLLSVENTCLATLRVALPTNINFFNSKQAQSQEDNCECDLGKHESNKLLLRMGDLALDLNDFLELRAGMKIIFTLPQQFETSLNADGNEIAKVMARVSEGKMELEVLNCTS